jgi:hypothetical protein
MGSIRTAQVRLIVERVGTEDYELIVTAVHDGETLGTVEGRHGEDKAELISRCRACTHRRLRTGDIAFTVADITESMGEAENWSTQGEDHDE